MIGDGVVISLAAYTAGAVSRQGGANRYEQRPP